MKLSHKLIATVFLIFGTYIAPAQWNLVWQDEFSSGISPDWTFEIGTGSNGWGNNELQYYRQENATVLNGHLVITAKQENFGDRNYTSARLKTQGMKSWRYGKIEARISMPSFSGVWPAFWMLGSNFSTVGWPACGEIDIMEHVNTEQATHGTIHWQDHHGNYASYGGSAEVDVSQFHLYAIEWDDQSIKWFVDGIQYHEVNIADGVNGTSEFHTNFFILLNMAIGGNWPGFNIDHAALPAQLRVDYVRVYTSSDENSSGFNQTIEAENYTVMSGVQTENCSEGGLNVGWIDIDDWMVWDVNLPSSGVYQLTYRVASLNGGGVLQLENAGGSPIYGSLSVPKTGGWQNWANITHEVSLNAGQQQIAIKALAGGWNINWLNISNNLSGSREHFESVTEPPSNTSYAVYPNPSKGIVYVRVPEKESLMEVAVLDISGKSLRKLSIDNFNRIDLSAMDAGTYLFRIRTDTHDRLLRIKKE